ncbi:hypothetical protein PSTEL_00650 [Paenibacillus stellifer]|uniref:DUF3383 family protein n=1 Tax=Paenibacillus stellifer TaxID=169760 RepID=A0A089LLU6_9BACL|nr:DUF3383 family protein [Paenibacillus stellifer]AIQ61857.1 hypothetical protein PSTEL_00650 [Paenibacillus stellifer]
MAGLSDVTVTISVATPTPILGFGKPLIIGTSAAGKEYKSYSDLAGVATDYATGTEEYKAAKAVFAQKNPPAEIAIAQRKTGAPADTVEGFMAAMLLKDWHFLIQTSAAVADITDVADIIEADKSRQYIARSATLADLATIKAEGYERTAVIYHEDIANYPDAAWVGAVGSLPVGSVTWKDWTLIGIDPLDLTASELAAIHAAGANTYVTKAGRNVTSEGKTVSGSYIDLVHSQDYVVFSIQNAVQTLFGSVQDQRQKVPYDNTGIAMIEGQVRTVLQRAFKNGMIATDDDGQPQFTTTFPRASEVDAADKAARRYPDGKFSFVLAGAIHSASITGTITFE